jgi:anti-sigma B factor antagonist
MRTVSIGLGTDDTLDVVLYGEVDFTNAAGVATAIRAAITDHRPRAVRVDLAEVSFLDSSGIGMLVQAMHAAAEIAAGFRVERVRNQVRDQLSITGLLPAFGLDPAGDTRQDQTRQDQT